MARLAVSFNLALALVLLLATGCFSPKPRSLRPSPEAVVLPGVPLERWGDNTCGAGALSTLMRFHGTKVSEDQLVPLLPQGRNGGVVSIDLLLAARDHGFDARLERGDASLLRNALADGLPSIVMLQVADMPGERRDLFHYIVIDGYDPVRRLFHAQFGDGKGRWIALDGMDRQWAATDYATLLMRPATKDGSAAEVADDLRRAARLEDQGRLSEARAIYESMLRDQPDSPLLWTNLGNVLLEAGEQALAERTYREALRLDPDQRDAKNNLAWLLLQRGGDLDEAERLARAAAASGADRFLYLDTLAAVLHARGRCDEAIETWRQAVRSIPVGQSRYRPVMLLALGRAENACGHAHEARITLAEALRAAPDETTREEIEALLARL